MATKLFSVAMFAETLGSRLWGGLDLEGDFDLDLGGDGEEARAPFGAVFLQRHYLLNGGTWIHFCEDG